MYIYYVCDIFFYYFIPCIADTSWSFSLWALYSASKLYTRPPGFSTLWQSSYCHDMYTRVVLAARGGTIPNLWAAFSLQVFYTQLLGCVQPPGFYALPGRRTQRSIANSVRVQLPRTIVVRYRGFTASGNYTGRDSVQLYALASLQLAQLRLIVRLSARLLYSCLAQPPSLTTLLIAQLLHVICVCMILTLLQVLTLPSGLLAFGLSPTFSKEECVRTVRSFSYA